MLEVKQLHAWYGESHILHGMEFVVNEGEVVTLLGRNGAGKTTTMKSIMGLVPRREGSIKYRGAETINLPPNGVAKAGQDALALVTLGVLGGAQHPETSLLCDFESAGQVGWIGKRHRFDSSRGHVVNGAVHRGGSIAADDDARNPKKGRRAKDCSRIGRRLHGHFKACE